MNLQKEAEVGIIDKVSLVNFMCHRKLDVSLNPNVNFILGRNGSKYSNQGCVQKMSPEGGGGGYAKHLGIQGRQTKTKKLPSVM